MDLCAAGDVEVLLSKKINQDEIAVLTCWLWVSVVVFSQNGTVSDIFLNSSIRSQFSLPCFVHIPDSRSYANTFIKRFSQGLRNSFAQVCKIIALNFYIFAVLLAACCSRKVENRDHAQSVHASFSRCSVIVHLGNTFVPRKSLCFSLLSSFSGVEITKRGKCSWGVYGYSTLKMITR